MTALRPLKGLVVIDEVQRRPDLFPVLRVLADRQDMPARFLILGSASGELLQQTSESLAGRMERITINDFVHRLCVDPAFQGQGIAKDLMSFGEKLALKRGIRHGWTSPK